ncbi:MAG: SsrA-binding protein SmpB [Flavobacteriales bacterium]
MFENNINIRNKQAKFEYEIVDTFTAGIMLLGTEIKSLRMGKASIKEAFCFIRNGEVFVKNMMINEYPNASFKQHEPKRERKLLLNRHEIDKLNKKISTKGMALIPLRLYINDKGKAKIDVALGMGKKLHDKRETLKERDVKRDLDRIKKQFK